MLNDKKRSQFRVLATLEAKEEKRQELVNYLVPLINPARKEEGNVTYDLHYSTDNPNIFLIDEVWDSKEAFDKHYESPKSYKDRKSVSSLLSRPLQIKTFILVNGSQE